MTQKITFAFFIVLTTTLFSTASAQEFAGYRSSNYTGVNGVFYNPANIADSRFRWDVNLLGVSALFGNNQVGFGLDTNLDSLANTVFERTMKNVDGIVAATINGPSVLFNIKKRNSVALFTRSHVLVNIDNINSSLAEQFSNDNLQNTALPLYLSSPENMTANVNAYTEFGVAFARVLKNTGSHFFKAGISLKYIAGVANGYLRIDNFKATLNQDNALLNPEPYLTDATGILSLGMGGINFTDFDASQLTKFKGSGFGVDLGAVYEWRTKEIENRRDLNKYKLKLGVAVLNIGSIKYTRDQERSQSYNIHIPKGKRFYLSELEDASIDDMKKVFESHPEFFTVKDGSDISSSYTVSLPTSLQLDADYHIHNGFYTSLSAQVPLATPNQKAANGRYHSYISLTPRYENKVVGVFLPMTYNNLTDFSAGAALRVGPLFLGSGSLISAAFGDSKKIDVFVGLHIGILHKDPNKKKNKQENKKIIKTLRDTDGDGVFDDKDVCIDTPGLPEFSGCPDSDGDGIPDAKDDCKNKAGLAMFNGCADTDADGVKDGEDKCLNIAGPVENNGCPYTDSDSDGVLDKDDQCPEVAGISANNGCPKVTVEVIKELNEYSKTILFDLNKARINESSYEALDAIVTIMNAHKNAHFHIAGYTDSVGKANYNEKLSRERAASVREYLTAHGVGADRLTSEGYGEKNPIATNSTAAGRQQNRRVEVGLEKNRPGN